MSKKSWLFFAAILWISFLSMVGLTVYVNYFLPHGPKYPTGEYVCKNDDRGPCTEEYIEDMRNLAIPEWAKFLRKSEGKLLVLGTLFAAIFVSSKTKEGDSEDE